MKLYSMFVKFVFVITMISTFSLFGFLVYLSEVRGITSYPLVMCVIICITATIVTAVWMFKRNEHISHINSLYEE